MNTILCLNPISKIGLSVLTNDYQITDQISQADAVLVRSAVMHEMALPPKVVAVARAGAGVNNIPLDAYAQGGVVVFNTPGANANAVKELIIAGMLLASRDIYGGMRWITDNQHDPEIVKNVEKVKSRFGGTEIEGKSIGIIGLGAVGMKLAKACIALGMKVYACERFFESLSKDQIPQGIFPIQNREELYKYCDFISLNLPLSAETKHMINQDAFNKMKDGVILLNFARDALVNDQDLEQALKSGKVRKYVTDFPNQQTASMEGVIAIPHLGASTEEAEDHCAMMAAQQIMDFVEIGTIKNSVNYPEIILHQKTSTYRILILYDAKMDVMSSLDLQEITSIESSKNSNYGVIVLDSNHLLDVEMIRKIKGVYRVRHI